MKPFLSIILAVSAVSTVFAAEMQESQLIVNRTFITSIGHYAALRKSENESKKERIFDIEKQLYEKAFDAAIELKENTKKWADFKRNEITVPVAFPKGESYIGNFA
jgi:hypothetical protein